ncbi:MAG: lipase family protein [Dehalococcoidia bacterium]|nr:MAG: hypothetical protein CBD90_00015 [Chloroflexi bacterium TMED230]RZP14408.1 MAG: lipase family protein [Chloroflexota bacterium]|tara:strand:+ start:1947 stop:3233 length:1287 start_codon:yes stop_codon:yes gene_type:complete
MKKILVTVVLFLVSCSSGTSEAEIKTDAKEIGNSLVNATSKIEEKPSVSLQQIGFESILPDIVYQNFLVLKDYDYAKQKSEVKGYKIINDEFIRAPGEKISDKFSINLSGGLALIVEKDDILFVTYRSTHAKTKKEYTKNVITDLDGAMVEADWISSDGVFVHRGFDSEYDRFRNTMLEIINDKKPSKIIVSGHSLGSALATLSALDLSMNYGYDVSLVSMGGPRVGNKEYRELMDNYVKDNYRIYIPEDPIINIPGSLKDYEHSGFAFGINPDGTHNSEINIDNFGFNAYRSIFDERFNIHHLGNYIKSINKILGKCYKDQSECFNMQEGYKTSLIERETMNQFRIALRAKPQEFIDETMEKAIGNIEEEKKKIKEITSEFKEKTNAEVLSNLDVIIEANKAKTEWVKSYSEKAKSLKDKAKDLLNK